MRNLFIANWKMYKTVNETESTLKELKSLLSGFNKADVAVAPPFTSLSAAKSILAGSNIALAAQNVHFEDKGAFTGEISVLMLKDLGVKYVIIGHSERRHIFGETDEMIAKKVKKTLDLGMIPVLCIGETKKERDSGKTFDVLGNQLKGSLAGTGWSGERRVVIAYEPVWAIGTGDTATPQTAQEAHEFIRERIAQETKRTLANEIIILYGGSVKPDNIASLMEKKDLNGALVGGASLEALSFSKIVKYS
jgi:triosephosphate isomerase (TIM)